MTAVPTGLSVSVPARTVFVFGALGLVGPEAVFCEARLFNGPRTTESTDGFGFVGQLVAVGPKNAVAVVDI